MKSFVYVCVYCLVNLISYYYAEGQAQQIFYSANTSTLIHGTCTTRSNNIVSGHVCSSNWLANILMVPTIYYIMYIVCTATCSSIVLHAPHIKTTLMRVYCTPGIIIIINDHHRHYRSHGMVGIDGSIIEFRMYTNSIIGVGKLYVTWFYKFYCGCRPLNTQSSPL